MAASVGGGSDERMGVEEMLFFGVFHGSLEEFAFLLGEVEDIDVRGEGRRTLLHAAVRGGRAEWAEALLQAGADPGVVDGEGCTVVQAAEEECGKHPRDGDRQLTRRMVRLAHHRDAAILVGPDGRGRLHVVSGNRQDPVFASNETLVSTILNISKELSSIRSSQSHMKEKIETLSRESTFHRESLSKMEAGMSSESKSIKQEMASLSTGTTTFTDSQIEMIMDLKHLKEQQLALSGEVTTLTSSQTQKLELLSSSIKEDMGSLSTAITSLREVVVSLRAEVTSQKERQLRMEEEMSRGMTSTNSEVRNVRETLTSLAEDVRVSREQLKEEKRRFRSNYESSNLKIRPCVDEFNKRMVQHECISALMAATEILDANQERTAKVRRAYERVYSCSTLTSRLLTFLQRQPRVKVRIDCSSCNIGRMRQTLINLDGVQRSGRDYGTFVDLEEKTSYVAGGGSDESISGLLAETLSQLAVSLAFSNGGLPYRVGDRVRGRKMARVVQAAEQERRKGELVDAITWALGMKSQSGKEVNLIGAVPWIITTYGSAKGTSILNDQAPSLLPFYNDHVLPALSP